MAESIAQGPQARPMVEITLVRDRDDTEWHLDWAAFTRRAFRMTVQPQGIKPTLHAAFREDFLQAVLPYLPEKGAESRIVTSSVNIELPGLILGKMRVLFTQRAGAVERLMLRFQQGFGDLQAILLPHLQNTETAGQMVEEAAVQTLLDLVHPCLELASIELDDLQDHHYLVILERLIALRNRKEELNLFALLLQRFLARRDLGGGAAMLPVSDRYEGSQWRYRPLGLEAAGA